MSFPSAHITALSNDGMGTVFHLLVLALQILVATMFVYACGKLVYCWVDELFKKDREP